MSINKYRSEVRNIFAFQVEKIQVFQEFCLIIDIKLHIRDGIAVANIFITFMVGITVVNFITFVAIITIIVVTR